MPYPFGQMPTLREFIEAALEEGCEEKFSEGEIVGQRGAAKARYLVGRNGVIYIVPNMKDNERLAPSVMASMARALKIRAFLHLYQHLLKE